MQIKQLLILIAAVSILGACSGGPTNIDSDLGIKGAPDWVNEGSQAVSDKNGRLIHGLGSAPSMGDEALQRSTADTRARAEIARVLSTYMNVAMRDFMQAQTAAQSDVAETTSSSSTEIEQDITAISNVIINGSKIIGRWKDKRSGNLYAFAELDLKKLDQAIQTAEKLNQNYKDHYGANSANIFDRFSQESN